MKARGWNGEWLEVGLSRGEAIYIKEMLRAIVVGDLCPPTLASQATEGSAVALGMFKTMEKVVRAKGGE